MSIYKMRTEFGHVLKWLLGVIVVVFIFGAVYSFAPAPKGGNGSSKSDKEVVAQVNGEPITRGEYDSLWDQQAKLARDRGNASNLQFAQMRAMVFQELVSNRMTLAIAKTMGVDVSDSRVNEEIDKAVTQYLKQNRLAVLGKLKPEREAVDPRDDSEYKSQLSSLGQSIDSVTEQFKTQIPPLDSIRAQMAQGGIQDKIRAETKPVTNKDIIDSYKTYKIRMILLRSGRLPKPQLSNLAGKIQADAAGGGDFATLAKKNSDDPSKSTGGAVVYSFQTSMMFPPTVREAVTKMNPNEVSRVIDTPAGFYIVKLESVMLGPAGKLDAKESKARSDQLTQERMQEAMLKFQQQMGGKDKVEVIDPELRGYWQMSNAMQFRGNPDEYKKMLRMAIGSLKKASGERANNYGKITLVQLLYQDGQVSEAIRVLYPMLEGDSPTAEGADLRLMLGDMMLKTGKAKDREVALQQYITASEVAQRDIATHEQLAMKFQQLKRPDLAANELKLVAEFKKQDEQIKAMRKPDGAGRPGPQAPGR